MKAAGTFQIDSQKGILTVNYPIPPEHQTPPALETIIEEMTKKGYKQL